ncbi:MAG: hypothetical protein E6G02_06615 [Actinobacteria bacterium]|nr:MAG: hypothetical protein E6G02_06615 [Actinomycetota bacterium]
MSPVWESSWLPIRRWRRRVRNGADTAQLLLEHGAVVNAFADNEIGVHPLNSAAAAGRREVAAILLEHGADPNAPTRRGFTPLDAARENDDEKLAELLRSHGARDEPSTRTL